ncbi:MAG: zinc ribbon domain-containing protein [Actinobacteria bacterium]|nr:zinc ribbon domain-containing protein [Actinomycetota bacterium]
MKACPVCRTLNNDNSAFCKRCGSKIEEKVLFCSHCGSKILSTNKFCKSCGKEIKSPVSFTINSKIKQPSPVSVNKITSVDTQASPNQKKSKKKLIISLSAIGSVLFLGLAITLILIFSIFPLTNPDKVKAKLGPDQERVIKLFGYPDQFLIMFDEGNNNNRIDAWTYSEMETIFIFENGAFDSTKEYYNKVFLENKQKVFPDNFIYAMTPDEVKTLIRKESVEKFDENTGLKVLTFGKGDIICIFNPDDELIIVSKQLKLSEDI